MVWTAPPPGITRSSSTTSGLSAAATSKPSAAFPASPTTRIPGSSANSVRNPSRTIW